MPNIKRQVEKKPPSLYSLLYSLWHHLRSRRQWQFGLTFGLMLISAVAEMISLGAVIPFLGVVVAPEKVFHYKFVAYLAKDFGIESAADLLLPFTLAFALAAIIAGAVRIALLWCSYRLAWVCGAEISYEAYRRTLYQPYQIHLARNSTEVSSGITSKVYPAISVMSQMLTLISASFIFLSITIVLFAVNAEIAALAALFFGIFYVLLSWVLRRRLASNSKCIAQNTVKSHKALNEGLGGIRDVLLDGTQPFFCNLFFRAELPRSLAMSDNAFIGGCPRFVMEAVGMAMIAIFAYHLNRNPDASTPALIVLGTLAMGAQRMLPALQNIFAAWATIAGSRHSLSDMIELLEQPLPDSAWLPQPAPLDFHEAIHFENVDFRYRSDGDGTWILHGINLTIPKGTSVGFVGSTGSGKSTLLDLLMGLISPTNGRILVDNKPLDGMSVKAWHRNIAHVPQNIFLTDASIAENIAFGIPIEQIDMQRVRQVASKARIAEFIESSTCGYQTSVGERGIRLSGGQRQRIGIARALYKKASVLVFDEATSALDNITEIEVMDAIRSLEGDLTILIVAHRLTTVKSCNRIVELGEGQIKGQGTFEELMNSSKDFWKQASANGNRL